MEQLMKQERLDEERLRQSQCGSGSGGCGGGCTTCVSSCIYAWIDRYGGGTRSSSPRAVYVPTERTTVTLS